MIYRNCECPDCHKPYRVKAVYANPDLCCSFCGGWFVPPPGGPLIFRPEIPCDPVAKDLMERN